MSTDNPKSSKETDLLQYKSNSVPRSVRLWWTLVTLFSIIYLVRYMLPDLSLWIEKLK